MDSVPRSPFAAQEPGLRPPGAPESGALAGCPPDVLESLFRGVSFGLAVLGPDLAVRCHNPAWEQLTGIATGPVPLGASPVAAALREVAEAALRGDSTRRAGLEAVAGRCLDLSAVPLGPEPSAVGVGAEATLSSEVLAIAADATERVEAQRALAAERLMLERRVADRTRELSTLLEVTRNVGSTLSLGPLLGEVLEQLRSVVGYDGAWIYRLEGSTLRLLAYRAPVPAGSVSAGSFSIAVDEETLDSLVVANQQPVIIDDVRGESALAREFRRALGDSADTMFGYIRGWLSVPLVSSGRVIGKLALDSTRPNRYSEHDADLALAFANQVAVAMENAELYERVNQRAAQLAAVARVSAAIAGTLDLPSLLELVAQAIQLAAGYECALVSLVEGDPPVLRRVASVGLDAALFERATAETTPLSRFLSLARDEYRLGRAYFYPGNEAHRWSSAFPSYQVMPCATDWQPGQWHPQNMLIEPLVDSAGRLVGIISVDKPYDGRAPTAESVEILDLLSHQATIAIVNARLYERAKESAVAAERSRLARDLHDAVTQTLFSASLIAEVLPRLYDRDPDEGRRRIEELRQLTRGALAEMRTLLLELRPAALTDAAFASLIRQLAEATTGRARIPVSVIVSGEPRLPPAVQVALYRVAQEALNNVAKHSLASRAVVTVETSPECVELTVGDDGRGFDLGGARPDSLGLGIMRERVEAVGATLEIESAPGEGTVVTVRWTAQ